MFFYWSMVNLPGVAVCNAWTTIDIWLSIFQIWALWYSPFFPGDEFSQYISRNQVKSSRTNGWTLICCQGYDIGTLLSVADFKHCIHQLLSHICLLHHLNDNPRDMTWHRFNNLPKVSWGQMPKRKCNWNEKRSGQIELLWVEDLAFCSIELRWADC